MHAQCLQPNPTARAISVSLAKVSVGLCRILSVSPCLAVSLSLFCQWHAHTHTHARARAHTHTDTHTVASCGHLQTLHLPMFNSHLGVKDLNCVPPDFKRWCHIATGNKQLCISVPVLHQLWGLFGQFCPGIVNPCRHAGISMQSRQANARQIDCQGVQPACAFRVQHCCVQAVLILR